MADKEVLGQSPQTYERRAEAVPGLADGVQMRRDPILRSFYGLSGRIGLLGGSFDPVQQAHLAIAQRAKEALGLDIVVFIPNHQNPLKDREATSGNDRLEMLTIALQQDDDLFVCPMELEKEVVAYTVDTVREIHRQLADVRKLFFIAGSDCLPDLHRWKDVHELLGMVDLVTIARSDAFSADRIPALTSDLTDEEITMLQRNVVQGPVLPLSSTLIREKIAAGEIPYDSLPAGVGEFIASKKLYR